MDLMLVSFLALFFFLPLMFLLTRTKSKSTVNPSLYPPGKTGWPVIGETLEFLNTGRKGTPDKFITDRMHKFSSQIFRTSLLGEPAAVMCGQAGNKFLFSNENKLVTSWWPSSVYKIFQASLIYSTNEKSIISRIMLTRFLKPGALQRYVGIMDSIAKLHLKTSWENHEQVMVFPKAKKYTFLLACKLFMSIDDPVQLAKFHSPLVLLAAGIFSIPINLPGTPFNKAIKAANTIRKNLISVIKQRKLDLADNKASPTQDILSQMLLTCDDEGKFMAESDIAEKILALLLAGHDSASAAICFVVKYLAELPHVYNEVRGEQLEILNSKAPGELLNWDDLQKMKYTWNVVCEVMRLTPPVQGTFRQAIHDFNYEGFSIPKGWKLHWSTGSTHKDPAYFPEPEKFDPSRFEGNGPPPYTYVPFGGGPRMCPGKEYARLEILVFMHNVVTKFKWEKVLPDEKIVADPLPMPAKGLPVRLLAC